MPANLQAIRFALPSHDAVVYLLPTLELTIQQLKSSLPASIVRIACSRYKSESRQFEFLATRFLLSIICGAEAEIAYHATGRPYLCGEDAPCISISHTKGYVAIALCDAPIGIDIEHISTRQLRLRQRFMADAEWKQALQYATPEMVAAIGWSAKEALYKLVDEPGVSLCEGLACEWRTDSLLYDSKRNNEIHVELYNDLVIAIAYEKSGI